MKVVTEVQADVVASVRCFADGRVTAKAMATAAYADGRTVTAEIDLPADARAEIKGILAKAIKAVEGDLGQKLVSARAEALSVANRLGELKPTKTKGSK